jgi:hypothetical protein
MVALDKLSPMTRIEYDAEVARRPCQQCGHEVSLEHNPNNNALQVICPSCGSRRPWGPVVNLKQNNRKGRKPLPDGETLDSVWERWGNVCFACGAPSTFLQSLGIGRTVHHVLPHAQHGHKGPLVPICTLCHPVLNDRQRLYWFIERRLLLDDTTRNEGESIRRSDDLPRGSETIAHSDV